MASRRDYIETIRNAEKIIGDMIEEAAVSNVGRYTSNTDRTFRKLRPHLARRDAAIVHLINNHKVDPERLAGWTGVTVDEIGEVVDTAMIDAIVARRRAS